MYNSPLITYYRNLVFPLCLPKIAYNPFILSIRQSLDFVLQNQELINNMLQNFIFALLDSVSITKITNGFR